MLSNYKSNSENHKFDNPQSRNIFQTNNNSNGVVVAIPDRKVSLYTKLQESLQKYMSSHSKDLTLQGNKRYLGKSGDYYLQSKKGNVIVK